MLSVSRAKGFHDIVRRHHYHHHHHRLSSAREHTVTPRSDPIVPRLPCLNKVARYCDGIPLHKTIHWEQWYVSGAFMAPMAHLDLDVGQSQVGMFRLAALPHNLR